MRRTTASSSMSGARSKARVLAMRSAPDRSCHGCEVLAVKSKPKPTARQETSRASASEELRLGMLVKRAEQAMLRAKSNALKFVGLTPAQYVALHELDAQPGITAATLARLCLVSPQAIMTLLKSMEQQGLIARSFHPRHPNVLELHMSD